MHELTLKLLRSLPENKASEEYAEFYIHDMNKIISEYSSINKYLCDALDKVYQVYVAEPGTEFDWSGWADKAKAALQKARGLEDGRKE